MERTLLGMAPSKTMTSRKQSGLSMIELLVIMTVLGIAVASSSLFLKPAEAPLQSATVLTEGYLRQIRARAMSTTSAYRVTPTDATRFDASYATTCSATTWTADPEFDLELPRGVELSSTAWSLCFSSRGLASNNLTLTLQHPQFGTRDIEVLLGGTSRVLP